MIHLRNVNNFTNKNVQKVVVHQKKVSPKKGLRLLPKVPKAKKKFFLIWHTKSVNSVASTDGATD